MLLTVGSRTSSSVTALCVTHCRFKDVIECDRIVVHAFLTPHHISSFRVARLSDTFFEKKSEVMKRRTKGETSRKSSRESKEATMGRGPGGWGKGAEGVMGGWTHRGTH